MSAATPLTQQGKKVHTKKDGPGCEENHQPKLI